MGLDGEKVFSPAKMIRRRECFVERRGHFDKKKRNNLALMLGYLPALLASENLLSRSFLTTIETIDSNRTMNFEEADKHFREKSGAVERE